MPLQPQEVLDALTAATAEAKATIRDLHAARSLALDVSKKDKERVTTLIVEEVTKQVGALSVDARSEMVAAVTDVIDGLAESWRSKLGL